MSPDIWAEYPEYLRIFGPYTGLGLPNSPEIDRISPNMLGIFGVFQVFQIFWGPANYQLLNFPLFFEFRPSLVLRCFSFT